MGIWTWGHGRGFLAEARRVAGRVLMIDAAWREDVQPEEVQERVLRDGSRHSVYKRYFTAAQLAGEIGGGRVVHGGAMVRGGLRCRRQATGLRHAQPRL
jgi:hypothetical protein